MTTGIMNNLFSVYENTTLETHVEYAKRTGSAVRYDELGKKSSGGLPIASYRDENDKLNFIFAPESHALVIGSTRSGKTSGYVIPMIMAKAMQKEKSGMLITDPKGELYAQCSARLREQGYRVLLLNFRDYKHSENWNPLTPLFRKYQKAMNLEKTVTTVKVRGQYYPAFNGKTYMNNKDLQEAIQREKQLQLFAVANDVDTLCLATITTESQKDPYWENSARQLLQAFIFAMLEDSIPEKAGSRTVITEDTFSFRTLMSIYGTFNYNKDSSDGDNGYFTDRPDDSLAKQYAVSSIISNGNITRMCILSTFNAKMAPYKEIVTNVLTCCNTFELDELVDGDRPTAVFVVYRDESKTSYEAVRQFITATYNKLIEKANEKDRLQLDRPFFFLLDEFGNLPAVRDFDVTISACGGRNIWFVLVLQSYAQLENNYGKATAEIIKENLNVHIYVGTNNAETKRAFSEECGKRTIVSPRSVFAGESEQLSRVDLEEVHVVPVSKLNHLATGDCYITMSNAESVLFSHMERYYLCPEYETERNKTAEYEATADIFNDKYVYKTKKTESAPGGRNRRFSDFF